LREHEILVDNKPYKLKFEKCEVGVPFSVRVNEKDVEVKIENEPTGEKPFTITIQGKPYTVELGRIERRAPFSVKVNDIPFNVQFRIAERKLAQVSVPSVSAPVPKPSKRIVEEGDIVAPMAGKIISVKVKKGDMVKLGDVLCTLEAMKMENEITATKSGIVEEISVSEGMAVDEGDVLMKIK